MVLRIISFALFAVFAFQPVEALFAKRLTKGEDSGEDGENECSGIVKDEHTLVYCKSYMCSECCDHWCKEECDNLKEAMEEASCSCEEEPKAHSDKSYCKTQDEEFEKEHEDLTWGEQQAMSCAQGCNECCSPQADHGDSGFLLLQQRARRCHSCVKSLGKKAHVSGNVTHER